MTARRELVENELYEHATRLFAERGFAGTGLQDIADAMGITRPALYYYVGSKDELLANLVTEVTNGPLDDLTALVAREGLDPVQKLRGIVEVIVLRRTTQPARFRLPIRSEAASSWFRSDRAEIDRHRDGLTLDGQGLDGFTLFAAKVLPRSRAPTATASGSTPPATSTPPPPRPTAS